MDLWKGGRKTSRIGGTFSIEIFKRRKNPYRNLISQSSIQQSRFEEINVQWRRRKEQIQTLD